MEHQDQEWIYKASDGVEHGPYTTSEVRRYAAEGRIIPSGSLRPSGEDVGWRRASEVLTELSISLEGVQDEFENPSVPATEKPAHVAGVSKVSRTAFILLGLLPGVLAGLFGLHNCVAGYTTKGVVQIVLSVTLGWGMMCLGSILLIPFCIGIPTYLGLLIWTIVEISTVTVDAQGRPFQN